MKSLVYVKSYYPGSYAPDPLNTIFPHKYLKRCKNKVLTDYTFLHRKHVAGQMVAGNVVMSTPCKHRREVSLLLSSEYKAFNAGLEAPRPGMPPKEGRRGYLPYGRD